MAIGRNRRCCPKQWHRHNRQLRKRYRGKGVAITGVIAPSIGTIACAQKDSASTATERPRRWCARKHLSLPTRQLKLPNTITKGKSISRASHSAAQPEAADAPVQLSPRSCVLVVEDEPLVVMEIAQVLDAAGFHVAGPVDSTSAALELLRHERCDAAVLDINLGGETSEAIALSCLKAACRSSHYRVICVSNTRPRSGMLLR
jgi:Response regulator receiver domain